MKEQTLRRITVSGLVGALYAVVTVLWPLSYGTLQFRISEAFCVLPYFFPESIWGLTVGCLIANLYSSVSALDIAIGTAATLAAAVWTSRTRHFWAIPIPTILCNTVLVGGMLALVTTPDAFWQGFLWNAGSVACGETAVLLVLGMPLAHALKKTDWFSKL